MKKELVASILASALTAVLVAGCGGNTGTGASSSSSAAGGETSAAESSSAEQTSTTASAASADASDGEKVNLTFGFWGDDAEAQMKMDLANKYMEEHQNVSIEFEYCNGSDYLTKLQTWLSSNDAPDVFGIANDHLVICQDSEMFEDLAPYVEKDGLEKDWDYDAAKAAYTLNNGRMVAVPFVEKTFAIAYNKDLFDQAGVAYPTADWTEEDMFDAAEKINALGDDIYGLRWGVRVPEFYRNLYGNNFYDMQNYKMNVKDNAQFKAAVTMFSNSILDGLAPDETEGVISTGGFETGKFGMALSATWDIATYQSSINGAFKWDVVELPNNTEFNTRWLSTLRANGWCMNSGCENKDVAWDFIKYLSTTKESAQGAATIGIPVLKSYLESDEYLKDYGTGSEYNKEAFINMMDNATSFYNLGAFAEVNDLAKTDYEKILAGQMTVDEMIDDLDTQGTTIFASYGY